MFMAMKFIWKHISNIMSRPILCRYLLWSYNVLRSGNWTILRKKHWYTVNIFIITLNLTIHYVPVIRKNQCMYTISSTKLVATISDNVYYSNCQKEYNLSKYITCLYTYTCVMRWQYFNSYFVWIRVIVFCVRNFMLVVIKISKCNAKMKMYFFISRMIEKKETKDDIT